jgi:hypothetical protein
VSLPYSFFLFLLLARIETTSKQSGVLKHSKMGIGDFILWRVQPIKTEKTKTLTNE